MKNIKNLVWASTFLALLLILQISTKSLGQIVTGSSVNMILALSAFLLELKYSICIALLSPFFAFFLGIGPAFLPLTPAIAIANVIYVIIIKSIYLFIKKNYLNYISSIVIASICKFLVLWLIIVKFICNIFSTQLKPQQIKNFTTLFSFPQIITALIGGLIAIIIVPIIKKIFKINK